MSKIVGIGLQGCTIIIDAGNYLKASLSEAFRETSCSTEYVEHRRLSHHQRLTSIMLILCY
jgi:hypothetical protein